MVPFTRSRSLGPRLTLSLLSFAATLGGAPSAAAFGHAAGAGAGATTSAVPAADAPGRAVAMARAQASDALRRLSARVPPEGAARVRGIYVAFDGGVVDAYAIAACDDDGDPVVVVSDALLVELDDVAQAVVPGDETATSAHLDAYAALVARSRRPGARVLAPPPGFFDEPRDGGLAPRAIAARLDASAAAFRDAVAGAVAHELAHALDGVDCPAPTLTREPADDVWTADERRAAFARSPRDYAVDRVLDAEARAAALLVDAGYDTYGYANWLTYTAAIEATAGGAAPPYERIHPRARERLAIVRARAAAHASRR